MHNKWVLWRARFTLHTRIPPSNKCNNPETDFSRRVRRDTAFCQITEIYYRDIYRNQKKTHLIFRNHVSKYRYPLCSSCKVQSLL